MSDDQLEINFQDVVFPFPTMDPIPQPQAIQPSVQPTEKPQEAPVAVLPPTPDKTVLNQAYALEAREAAQSIEELMAEMLGNVEEATGYAPRKMDEMTIRRMLFARKYLGEEKEKLATMKQAVALEWDLRISKKQAQIDQIDGLVDKFIREENKGKALTLDVATPTLRKVPHKVDIKDKTKVIEHLKNTGEYKKFTKETLDETAAKKHYIEQLNTLVDSTAKKMIDLEIEDKGKVTKKREKEIKEQVLTELMGTFKQNLPEGFEFTEPSKTLSIKYNI